MHSFKDSSGAAWDLDLTIGAVKRVLARTGIDLRNPAGPRPYGEGAPVATCACLSLDAVLLADVLAALCARQLEGRGMTDEDFFEQLGPETIEAAHAALFAEWSDFFRRSGNAAAAAMLDRQAALLEKAVSLVRQQATQIEAKMTGAMEQGMATLGELLTSWPGSAGSAQTPSASASS